MVVLAACTSNFAASCTLHQSLSNPAPSDLRPWSSHLAQRSRRNPQRSSQEEFSFLVATSLSVAGDALLGYRYVGLPYAIQARVSAR